MVCYRQTECKKHNSETFCKIRQKCINDMYRLKCWLPQLSRLFCWEAKYYFRNKCLSLYTFLGIMGMLFCVFVFVRAILSWCPYTWHVYIVYNIFSLNTSPMYIVNGTLTSIWVLSIFIHVTHFSFGFTEAG